MAKTSVAATDKLEVAAYELKLPAQFDPKPEHVVDLPAGYKAYIYKQVQVEHHWSTTQDLERKQDGWRVIIRSRTGGIPNTRTMYNERSNAWYCNELEVKTVLEGWAHHLAKKKRTKTSEEVEDFDD